MAGINKVILVGHLGKDPEVKTLDSGAKVAQFSLATTEVYKDKTTGERKEITEWHNIVCWRNLADIAEQYLNKGKLVYVEGKLRTRSWDDATGAKRYTTEVVADNFVMLGAKQDSTNTSAVPQEPQQSSASNNTHSFVVEEDDLPF